MALLAAVSTHFIVLSAQLRCLVRHFALSPMYCCLVTLVCHWSFQFFIAGLWRNLHLHRQVSPCLWLLLPSDTTTTVALVFQCHSARKIALGILLKSYMMSFLHLPPPPPLLFSQEEKYSSFSSYFVGSYCCPYLYPLGNSAPS